MANYKYRLFVSTNGTLHLAGDDRAKKYICGKESKIDHKLLAPGFHSTIHLFVHGKVMCKECKKNLLRRISAVENAIKISGPGEGTERMKKLINRLTNRSD